MLSKSTTKRTPQDTAGGFPFEIWPWQLRCGEGDKGQVEKGIQGLIPQPQLLLMWPEDVSGAPRTFLSGACKVNSGNPIA